MRLARSEPVLIHSHRLSGQGLVAEGNSVVNLQMGQQSYELLGRWIGWQALAWTVVAKPGAEQGEIQLGWQTMGCELVRWVWDQPGVAVGE